MLPYYEALNVKWLVKLALLWGSWGVPLFLAVLLWRLPRRWPRWSRWRRAEVLAALSAALLFVQARFVEPNLLVVRETPLQLGIPARIALVADTHVGLYKSADFLERVVDRLNELDVDAVLIAGDHSYEPERPLAELLAPWRRLRHPAYSVLGNHDLQAPGPPIERELQAALRQHGVRPVDGEVADAGVFVIVGLGDHSVGGDIPNARQQPQPGGKPRLVLMHNPDTAMTLPRGWARLALAGHTHGGQIRIPGLYRRAIPTIHPFDRGLHSFAPLPTFVTSGLGEIGLPMRWLNPPVIDVLDLR